MAHTKTFNSPSARNTFATPVQNSSYFHFQAKVQTLVLGLVNLSTMAVSGSNSMENPISIQKKRGYRHKMAYMLFTTYLVSYCLRFNLSMAIIGMVNIHLHSEDNENATCAHLVPFNSTERSGGEFDWNSETLGMVLGSFFVGYMLTAVPGGVLAERYGGKWVVQAGLVTTSALALLTPVAARTHEWALVGVRFLQGMGEGVIAPAGHVLLAQWSPPAERSLLAAIAFAGNPGGALLAMLLTGLMIYSRHMEAWPEVFYISGGLGIMWSVFWALFAYNKPWDNPDMSVAEKEYIGGAIGDQVTREPRPVPWCKILRCKAVWGAMIAQAGNGIGKFTVMGALPTYLSQILHYDIRLVRQNSWLSGLPFLGMLLVILASGHLATWLTSNGIATTLTVRRSFNTVGHWFPAATYVLLAFTECNRELAVTLLFVAVSVGGAAAVGFYANHLDIGPQHAGVLLGFGNVVASLTMWATPYLVSLMGDDLHYWRLMFCGVAAILYVDNIFYLVMASDKEQNFNKK